MGAKSSVYTYYMHDLTRSWTKNAEEELGWIEPKTKKEKEKGELGWQSTQIWLVTLLEKINKIWPVTKCPLVPNTRKFPNQLLKQGCYQKKKKKKKNQKKVNKQYPNLI